MENKPSYNPDFENKLYIARDVEGEPNRDDLEIIRGLEERLSEEKSFVGIAPFGSVVGGYSTKESDIDLYVLYDSNDVVEFLRLKESCEEYKNSIWDKIQKKLQIIFTNVDPQMIIEDLKRGVKPNNPGESISTSNDLVEMTRVVTGKKIDVHRNGIREEIKKLSSEQQQKLSESVLDSLYRREVLSLKKRQERFSDLSEDEHEGILEERRKLWRKRIEKIWGI